MHKPKEDQPPKHYLKFVRFFLKPEYLEEIQGDLEEVFNDDLEANSTKKAKRLYAWEMLRLLHPNMIKSPFRNSNFNSAVMIKNYLKIGWRNILKHKGYTAINIFGLSVGIATTITLLMIIHYENSFDHNLPEVEQIYRVADEVEGTNLHDVIVAPALPLLVAEIPEIIAGTRFISFSTDYVRADEKFIKSQFHLVDSGFFKTFDLEVIQGDLENSLTNPGYVVLTRSTAKKFFQEENPVGQVLNFVSQKYQLKVGAIVDDRPKNSNIQFEILISWHQVPAWLERMGDWYNTFMPTYVKLSPGSSPSSITAKLTDFKLKHYRKDRFESHDIRLLPLTEEHGRNANNQLLLNVLAIIAVCILTISCINFINLSTTQSVGRAREIGIRKVMGSLRSQLITQFLTESLIISIVSITLGLVILNLAIPKVNNFFDLDMAISSFGKGTITGVIILSILTTGIFSGLYPALFISKLNPVQSLKSKIKTSKSGSYLQKGLLTLQFGGSILLIAGTLLISRQVDFMKSTELNFDGQETIGVYGGSNIFKDPESAQRKISLLMNELRASSLVKSVSTAQSYPGNYNSNYNTYNPMSEEGTSEEGTKLRSITIDEHYFQTLDIQLNTGENFSSEKGSEIQNVIVNQAAMTALGWSSIDDKYLLPNGSGVNKKLRVIGVVKDYYYQSLEMPIEPVIHYFSPNPQQRLIVKFEEGKVQDGIDMLETEWKNLGAYEALSFDFIDSAFNDQYKSHERLGTTVMVFSMIALIIAGLGLFSIASFTIKMKRKEVGVRKVLGASIKQLVTLLSSSYLGIVGLSLVLVSPLFYFMSERFLADFANRIDFDVTIILIAGACAVLIALICVSFEAIKTASSNPVNHLRDE